MLELGYILKIIVSMALGLFIGWERERQGKIAGIRTVTLVCLGATLFTIISLILRQEGGRYDIGRIIAYIIAGIGFLGSGVIIQHKGNVEGITTASVLWTIVGIGVLCGLGQYSLAVVSTLSIYFVLKLKHVVKRMEKK